MTKIVCDTSPIQYLHQLDLLRILPALSECVVIPPAVVREISVGKAAGVNLPEVERFDWLEIRQPVSLLALPLVTDLGPGETEVLMLALEARELVTVLDDALARQIREQHDAPAHFGLRSLDFGRKRLKSPIQNRKSSGRCV